MVIIDGAFLMGVAAVLTSLASLWRVVREDRQKAALNTEDQTKTAKVASCQADHHVSEETEALYSPVSVELGALQR
jgi:hypothetical protein